MSVKKKYIIDCCTFLYQSGGIVALHKLCHDLNSLGEESYITSPISHSALNAPFVSNRKFSKDEAVVIYPEVNLGNPHKAKHVVRWVLNTPPKSNRIGEYDFYNTKSESDLIFKYSEYFNVLDDSKISGILSTTFIDTDYFFSSDNTRKGSAFLIKKGGMKNKIHPDDAIDLSKLDKNWKIMSDVLRQVEYFYCYDNASYWAFLAALCGCTPIVVPDSNMSFEEWSEKFDHMKYGVAYGTENIEYAKQTKNLISKTLENTNKRYVESVKNFISICEKEFN
jgi:hypothetical protein